MAISFASRGCTTNAISRVDPFAAEHFDIGLKLLDALVFGVLDTAIPRRAVEGPSRLGQYLIDPLVDDAGLDLKFVNQLGHGLLAAQMATNDLGLLLRRKVTTRSGHGVVLLWGYC